MSNTPLALPQPTSLDQAIALHQAGQLGQAIDIYQALLKNRPEHATLLRLLGTAKCQLGELQEGIRLLGLSLAIQPNQADTYNNQGNALSTLKRFAEALTCYERALALKPDYAEAHSNQGNAYSALKRFEDALASYDRALALKPDYVEAYNNRGTALKELKRFTEALASYEQALALRPDYVEAHNNRGNVLIAFNRFEEAIESYDHALTIKPDYIESLGNRGNALKDLKRFAEAQASYDRALAINPHHAVAHLHKALVHLLMGQFEEGWRLYEWRWQRLDCEPRRHTEIPLWLGQEDIAGKTLLIHPEQGLGDYIQFCRYAFFALAAGINVILETPRVLHSLISTLHGPFTVVAQGQSLPPADYQCPVMSLPRAFHTTTETIPSQKRYLFASPEKKATWQQRLGPQTRLRVGLAWSGNPVHINDHNRSIALSMLMPCLTLPIEFHCLQQDIRPEDAAVLNTCPTLHVHQHILTDFSDTAALIEEMDLVLSVDTAIAHLAGALGKPVWIMLPFVPDYRWQLDRADCPWYPTATLFRCANLHDWPCVIEQVAQKLTQELSLPKK